MKLLTYSTLIIVLASLIAGCGSGETAATATVKAQEARQANETVKAVQNKLDQANEQAKQRLKAADE